jgi:hypothetical protein
MSNDQVEKTLWKKNKEFDWSSKNAFNDTELEDKQTVEQSGLTENSQIRIECVGKWKKRSLIFTIKWFNYKWNNPNPRRI